MQYLCKKNIEMDKIIGMGNALVDVLATLNDDHILTEMELPKGSMTLIDETKLLIINECFSEMETELATGGSAGNAIRGMACLGAGTGFIGKVGNDAYGKFYRQSLLERGTEANLLVSSELPSGVASTFISPDGERTFGTYLGAAATLKAEDLSREMFKGYTYLFIEGYLVQDHDMILRAIELAKEAGLQICLDMASYNIVEQDHDFFSLLINKYVDIVFANEEEAKAFTGKEPEEALDVIQQFTGFYVLDKKYENRKQDLKKINDVRNHVTAKMRVLTSYTDALQIYEYILNRLEFSYELVDEDVDIFDMSDVMWAMTTRFQADVDMISIPGCHCHVLDPSNDHALDPSIRVHGIACKAIFDCTVPFDQKENFVRSRFLEIDKDKWAKELAF